MEFQANSNKSHLVLKSQGFTLFETLIVFAIMVGIMTTFLFSFEGILERWKLHQALNQLTQTLKHAQFLSLTQGHSYGIQVIGTEIWISKRKKNSTSKIFWGSLPSDLTLSASRWPFFSPYGFANAGTVSLESKRYFVQIKVSIVGRIRQTILQSK